MRLVLDWDGTVTERDTPGLVVESFGDGTTYRRAGELTGRSLTHDQALASPEGWRIRFRDRAVCAACGEPCKRSSLPPGEISYAGDGHSHRCAALAATRVSATGALAEWLHARRVAFDPFEDFYDVLATLEARQARHDRPGGPIRRAAAAR